MSGQAQPNVEQPWAMVSQDAELWAALRRVFKTAHQAMPASARRLRMGRTDMAILEMAMASPVTPGELAKQLQVTPAAVSIALNRLESRGHLRRRADPNDARRVLVEITPLAQGEVAAELGEMFADIYAVVDRVPVERRAELTRFLSEVADVLQKHTDK